MKTTARSRRPRSQSRLYDLVIASDRTAAAEREEQFRVIAGGMFEGMLDALEQIHLEKPELLTVLAG